MEKLITILKMINLNPDYETEKALVDGGFLDSLDIITLVSVIYEEYGVLIPPAWIIPENFNSAQKILETVNGAKMLS